MAIVRPSMMVFNAVVFFGVTIGCDHLPSAQEHHGSSAVNGQTESVGLVQDSTLLGLHAQMIGRRIKSVSQQQHQGHKTLQESLHMHNDRVLLSANATVSDDVQALLDFKRCIVADPLNATANWVVNETDPYSHCHTWTGVGCNSNLQVVSLGLPASQLVGTISPSIGKLAHLTHVDFTQNNFSGSFPSSLQNCANLSRIYLGFNKLTGNIPKEIGQLTQLRELLLFFNKLTGVIPPSLQNCRNMTILALMFNNLNGVIPASLGRLTQLQQLLLDDNNLTGILPPSLGNCRNLTKIYLCTNNLIGSIPTSFGQLTQLRELCISTNKLSGNIPRSLGDCRSLIILRLFANELTGTIPTTFGQLKQLQELHISSNKLIGTIPPALQNCGSLIEIDLYQNNLTGSIPMFLGQLTHLNILVLVDNQFTGTIPESLGDCRNLTKLHLGINQLTGTIPSSLGQLTNLEELSLSNNNLSGVVPLGLLNLTHLRLLDLGYNQLSGGLFTNSNETTPPFGFSQFPLLEIFSASNNNFTGRVPSFLGSNNSRMVLVDLSHNQLMGDILEGGGSSSEISEQFANLRVLSLAYNSLSGKIPRWVTNLTSLQVIDLSHNYFEGAIPQHLHNMQAFITLGPNSSSDPKSGFTLTQVVELNSVGNVLAYPYILETNTHIDLSSNALTGPIPTDVGDLVGLKHLYLGENNLTGSIPPIGGLLQLEAIDLSNNKLDGAIPSDLGNLTSLSYFNVSRNNLSGPIPTNIHQFATFMDASLFLPGNDGLCGKVINRSCSANRSSSLPHESYGVGGKISMVGFSIGWATGFGFVMSLVICRLGQLQMIWMPSISS